MKRLMATREETGLAYQTLRKKMEQNHTAKIVESVEKWLKLQRVEEKALYKRTHLPHLKRKKDVWDM